MANVLLLQMPFASIHRPNLGLSLLKGSLLGAGHRCELIHPNISLARRLTAEVYEVICRNLPQEYLFGEYLFSGTVFDRRSDYVNGMKRITAPVNRSAGGYTTLPDWLAAETERLAGLAEEFLEELAAETDWARYDLVGMGTTFHQTLACVGLARRIKRAPGAPRIILGGANCEAEMGVELHRRFPWLDFVCLGEGERLIAEVAGRIDAGAGGFEGIPGLAWRDPGGTPAVNGLTPAPVEDLDGLPVPDYRDWLGELEAGGLASIPIALPLQTSRGCWYGERRHCVFCGLNGSALAFRSKSPQRVIDELGALSGYPTRSVYSVDCVLDHRYFRTLLPRIREADLGLDLFFETRPNLSREQVRRLSEAGILWIQPGIESLSSHCLSLMGKGVRACQNVLLLKYAAECGVGLLWNILCGFPGESEEDYLGMAELVPVLSHLQAPSGGCHRVRLDRFSPMQTDPGKFRLRNVRPFPAYRFVFPLDDEALSRIAYYFTFDYEDHRVPEAGIAALKEAVARWQEVSGQAALLYVDRDGAVTVWDTRSCAVEPEHHLEGPLRALFLACDEGRTLKSLREDGTLIGCNLERGLADLMAKKLLIEIDGRVVNVAVAAREEAPEDSGPGELRRSILAPYLDRVRMMRLQMERLRIRTAAAPDRSVASEPP